MSWVSLNEISKSINYGLTASATDEVTGFKFLRITDIANGIVDYESVPNVWVDSKDVHKYLLQHGDIVVARTGASTGANSYFMGPENVLFASYLVRFRIKPTVDSRFVSYVLKTNRWDDFIYANAFAKSAQPNLSASSMAEFEFELPALSEQRAIADVLGALDDKIVANQRTLAIQSDLIQSLVLRASRGQCPTKLSDVANSITRGVAPKYSEKGALVLNQKCIREKVVSLDEARRLSNLPANESKLVETSDVLVNSTGVGTLGRAARWTLPIVDVTVDSHVTIVKFDRNAVDPDFAGAVLVSMENRIEDLAEGSTGQTELRRHLLGTIPLPLPEITVQRQNGAVIRDLDAMANGLIRETQALVNTRDELLPLLMNGKITVAEANEEIEARGVDKHAEGADDV
ncbi:restriction endonuclease subunit S [Corynebacterium hindlerae]|uniref:restriction endonuclease subunit S n=1 Tax=Corynebacterium hindlerae TaxID=699041 RepID=UPI0031B6FBB5